MYVDWMMTTCTHTRTIKPTLPFRTSQPTEAYGTWKTYRPCIIAVQQINSINNNIKSFYFEWKSSVGGPTNQPCKRLVSSKSKVLREGGHPYSIAGHFGTVFIEEYVLESKAMEVLLWSGRWVGYAVRCRWSELGPVCTVSVQGDKYSRGWINQSRVTK